MERRKFLGSIGALGVVGSALSITGSIFGSEPERAKSQKGSSAGANKLSPPAKGKIPVGFVISTGVTVIDFAGPWEVFQDVMVAGRSGDDQMPFHLFTVSDKIETITATAGLKLVPDYTFADAPECKVIVVPAQKGSETMREWLRKVEPGVDVLMSVCTGAFQLARAGLLNGKAATTHHDFLDELARRFPDIDVKRGVRFVEGPRISTAGGLSSGIDLALRVVERYFGRGVAETTAAYMEYQGKGWMV